MAGLGRAYIIWCLIYIIWRLNKTPLKNKNGYEIISLNWKSNKSSSGMQKNRLLLTFIFLLSLTELLKKKCLPGMAPVVLRISANLQISSMKDQRSNNKTIKNVSI